MSVDRDRDEAGRPRNARPRDATGRPLERDALGVPEPAEVDRSPDDAVAAAQQALDEGRPFVAHEILEGVWRGAPTGERDFWQGLAQLAVALTHLQRGNLTGCQALLERGRDRLAAYAGTTVYGVDVDRVRAQATSLGEQTSGAAGALRLRD